MGEKIRGALFGILGDITGLSVLDAFAGSGALSFEAISRGAYRAIAIELDKNAQNTVKNNIAKLKLDQKVKLVPGNCSSWSDRSVEQRFNLVLCDPPYDRVAIGTISKLGRHVDPAGMLVLLWPKHLEPDDLPGFKILKTRVYASARLVFYRRT